MQASGRRREYELIVRQEPKQARMCGVGGKADRRPIDPPPIIQLRVLDSGVRDPSPEGEYAGGSAFMQNPYYFMFASLAKPDADAELHWLKDGKTRCMTGSVVSSLYHLKDTDNDGEDAGFFVFPDLSVRTEGSYRLKLSLFEVVGRKHVHHCRSIYTAPFYVYTAKKFPGMEESTPLSCALADQGIKIRIRKDIRIRKKPSAPFPLMPTPSTSSSSSSHPHGGIMGNNNSSGAFSATDPYSYSSSSGHHHHHAHHNQHHMGSMQGMMSSGRNVQSPTSRAGSDDNDEEHERVSPQSKRRKTSGGGSGSGGSGGGSSGKDKGKTGIGALPAWPTGPSSLDHNLAMATAPGPEHGGSTGGAGAGSSSRSAGQVGSATTSSVVSVPPAAGGTTTTGGVGAETGLPPWPNHDPSLTLPPPLAPGFGQSLPPSSLGYGLPAPPSGGGANDQRIPPPPLTIPGAGGATAGAAPGPSSAATAGAYDHPYSAAATTATDSPVGRGLNSSMSGPSSAPPRSVAHHHQQQQHLPPPPPPPYSYPLQSQTTTGHHQQDQYSAYSSAGQPLSAASGPGPASAAWQTSAASPSSSTSVHHPFDYRSHHHSHGHGHQGHHHMTGSSSSPPSSSTLPPLAAPPPPPLATSSSSSTSYSQPPPPPPPTQRYDTYNLFSFCQSVTMTSTIDPSKIGQPPPRRRHVRTLTGYLPERDATGKPKWPRGEEKVWKAGLRGVDKDTNDVTKSIVHHVQTSLARQAYNVDDLGAYQATALAVRDNLIRNWNETQLSYTAKNCKRAYYLSLEFLMGRTLDNALLNLGLKDQYKEGTTQLGFNLEDLLAKERDAALGNGGLGRLAACYLDSSASQELPLWGYGLRYKYGIFQQHISPEGQQLEAPDPWLEHQNPWELPRLDVTYEVRFYGRSERQENGRAVWSGGQEVLAVAYDVMIPGYGTKTTNNLRLWDSKSKRGFDLNSFNAGDYEHAVESSNSAEAITSVLYPNDNTTFGKELRLKQQYFWTAASLADIMRRFKNTGQPLSKFPEYNAIQLNDTHPTLAIPELMRILLDEEGLQWNQAWAIVTNTFFFTNHTVLPEALEKWPVPLMEHLLPRHLQIIFDINLFFLQAVEKEYPNDRDRLTRMSLIEEGYPQNVRMAFLAVIGSRKVNGVAELHSDLLRATILKDFVEFEGLSKFSNVTNGITPRRWLDQCNPELSELITKTLKLPKTTWLRDLNKLEGLLEHVDDPKFCKEWAAIKQRNKERLAHFVESTLGLSINTHAMFDVQIKRLHEYKRQTLNILGVIHRYLTLKAMAPAERKKVNPRAVFFAGKAAPGYYIAKLTIRLIVNVAKVINADPDTQQYLSLYFLPDYSVSLAEVLIPSSDISQHISTAGTEASGTSNMKFCLNGGLLLGTVDGANIEIAEEVGESNVFFFGHLTPAVEDLRHQHRYHPVPVEEKSPALAAVLNTISKGMFGDGSVYEPLLNTIRHGDHYLLTDDFDSYIEALRMVDEAYLDKDEWVKKSIRTTAKMGKFSSDRAIQDYAQEFWNIEAIKVDVQA